MSLRIRKDGRILCGAIHSEQEGDTHINDELHYQMSVIHKVIVTEPNEQHMKNGEWWWRNNVPIHISVDNFYKE